MTRNRDPMKPCPVMEAFQNYREALECGQHDQAVAELATLQSWLDAPRWRPAEALRDRPRTCPGSRDAGQHEEIAPRFPCSGLLGSPCLTSVVMAAE